MPEAPWFDSGLHVRLPAETFVSQAEFEALAHHGHARLERETRTEAALAATEAELSLSATCAPCLRPALLRSRTEGGRLTEAGLRLPDWPAQQTCDCEDRLPAAARLLLHAAQSAGGLRGWTRLLLIGPTLPVHRRLAALAGATQHLPDLSPGPTLAAADAAFDLIVAADCLHRAPGLRAVLGELLRVAAPGACLLATFPFRERAAVTGTRRARAAGPRLAPAEINAIGWDLLPTLRDLGWTQAEMLRCWSRELGYLGAHNFILRAIA